MKKLSILFLSFVCLSSLNAFANSPCDSEMAQKTYKHTAGNRQQYRQYYYKTQQQCQKPCQKVTQKQCVQPVLNCQKFLCTNADMNTLFKNMCLSETQICNAQKIQEKYEQEVLSLTERIECENQKYCQMKEACAKKGELRKQKRLIKKLEKKRKEICKCYEKEFKTTLSKDQQRAYNKYKKCN